MDRNLSTPHIKLPPPEDRKSFLCAPKDKYEVDTKLPEKLLRASDVAEILNISKSLAYQLMQQGKIRTVVIQAARRVRPEDLKTFIEENLNP